MSSARPTCRVNGFLRIVALVTLGSFLLFAGCAATTPIVDLQNAPKDQEIQVVTKGGVRYRFDRWRLDDKQAVVGFTKASGRFDSGQLDVRVIPADSIQSVSLVDRTAETIGKVSLTVLGPATGVAFLWILVRALSVFAGFSVG